ncbi:MAG: DUF1573 domain-containing protein [Candidatus Stahlbacteria bacterium]|nr:DUF1573 domain-containing protein [Candidatus Stahlbacteria bacterium]
MKPIIAIAIILLVGCSSSRKITSPRIEFQEKEFNFGEIAPVDQEIHLFKFKNVGGDTLIITDIRAP